MPMQIAAKQIELSTTPVKLYDANRDRKQIRMQIPHDVGFTGLYLGGSNVNSSLSSANGFKLYGTLGGGFGADDNKIIFDGAFCQAELWAVVAGLSGGNPTISLLEVFED